MRFFFVLLLSSQVAFANIQRDVQQIIDHTAPNINIGIVAHDLTTAKTVVAIHPHRAFIPASNLKLYTAVAALSYLHPDFEFKTQFLSRAKIISGTLMGDLYLKMVGAPDFDSAQLKLLVKKLRQAGVKRIQGRIYIDSNTTDNISQGPGWMWDDAPHCFAAPVGAIVLDHNCIDVPLTGRKKLRLTEPPIGAVVNIKRLNVAQKKKHCKLNVTSNSRNHYTISGCLRKASKSLSLAIKNPNAYLIVHLKRALKKNEIIYNKAIKLKAAPKNAKVVAEELSAPLHVLITHMLKESDNLYADNIFKFLGHNYFDSKATWHMAAAARKKILTTQYKLDFNNTSLVDGSGLSQYNLTTPKLTVDLLTRAYQDFQISAELMAALPVAGSDGTLKKRLTQEGIHYKVRAKTGSLSHISSLSGYIQSQQQHLLAFSIYINGARGKADKYRKLEDEIIIQLAQLD